VRHLREFLRAALLELGQALCVLIFFHDLQLAEPSFLELLRELLADLFQDPALDWAPAAPERFRGLLLCSMQDEPITQELLESAQHSTAISLIQLKGLSELEMAAVLNTPQVRARIHKATWGRPAVLQQFLESLPPDPESLWRWRLRDLNEEQRQLLKLLAVYGRPASLQGLQQILGSRPDLGKLVQRGILTRAIEQGQVRFLFKDEIARQLSLAALSSAERCDLHAQIAAQLARRDALGMSQSIAQHYMAAGQPEAALPYALEAADHLESVLALRRAARLLSALAKQGISNPELLYRLVQLYTAAGSPKAALPWMRKLLELRPPGPEERLLLARLFLETGSAEEANVEAIEGLSAAQDPLKAALQGVAAEAAFRLGDLKACRAQLEALSPKAPQRALQEARNALGKGLLYRAHLTEAMTLFEENWREASDEEDQARALINLGIVHLQREDPETALPLFERARGLGPPRTQAIAEANLAVLYDRRQDFGRALLHHHRATTALRRLGQSEALAAAVLNLADLHLRLGDQPRARRLIEISEALSPGHSLLDSQRMMLSGDLARAERRYREAERYYTEALSKIQAGESSNQRLSPLQLSLAELILERDLEEAEPYLQAAAQSCGAGEQNRMGLLKARFLIKRGEHQSADELLKEVQLSSQGDLESAWRASAIRAKLAWSQGEQERATEQLSVAEGALMRLAASLPKELKERFLALPPRAELCRALQRVRAGLHPWSATSPEQAPDPQASRWRRRYPAIIGESPEMFPLFRALDRVAATESAVLIQGESGTGKELVAAALHAHSPRSKAPFICVNCAAFVENLLLSELFGHEQGAFTGAQARKRGRFELAHGGTLFLDEIGDISPSTQVALLRVLQEGIFERVGGEESLRVDVRLIYATHRNLEEMVREGEFRKDLYYRLRGVLIELPPLRARQEDIPRLAEHFLVRSTTRSLRFADSALASMLLYPWPGNIRELENVVSNLSIFAESEEIEYRDLSVLGDLFPPPDKISLTQIRSYNRAPQAQDTVPKRAPAPQKKMPWLEQALEEVGSLADLKKRIELEAITRALREHQGNITSAARRLGMKRPRLSQIIQKTPSLKQIKEEFSS